MGRKRTAGVEWRNGKAYARVRLGRGMRPRFLMPTCTTDGAAEARANLIGELVDKLIGIGRSDLAARTAEEVAAASTEKAALAFRVAVDGICNASYVDKKSLSFEITFAEFAKKWTSGELSVLWPDIVPEKDWSADIGRLKNYINPIVGDVPIGVFRLEHAHEVMRRLPEGLSRATRRHTQQTIGRIMNLAVYPAALISASPIPKGFLVRLGKGKAKSFLYPDEEARLLGTTAVPLAHRVLYGVMAREGPRVGDFLGTPKKGTKGCTWATFDLSAGILINDWNKTDDPRSWRMSADVIEALKLWKDNFHPNAARSDFVFVNEAGVRLNPAHLATEFRAHLKLAGVDRAELFERSEMRLAIRTHDLRATFITLSLAGGKSERWVMARTGHTSSAMLSRYDRAARTAREAGMTSLHSMVECIPELKALRDADNAPKADPLGELAPQWPLDLLNGFDGPQNDVEDSPSLPFAAHFFDLGSTAERHAGSSPAPCTEKPRRNRVGQESGRSGFLEIRRVAVCFGSSEFFLPSRASSKHSCTVGAVSR
jgi:hypothetical protein